MKLKENIDADIRQFLKANGIKVAVDDVGRILIHEFRMDTKGKMGMLYLKPESQIPKGGLPFLVGGGDWTSGVFHVDGEAVIIEIGIEALTGQITDYYETVKSGI